MSEHTRMALERARAKAAEIDAEQDAIAEQIEWENQQAAFEDHYIKRVRVPAGKLVTMWETGTNEHGQPLSDFEFQALCAVWYLTFGELPPQIDCRVASATTAQLDRDEPMPADDAMLSPRDVVRITGVSLATIKRMVTSKRFPDPLKLSPRRIGWTGKDVRVWLEKLHDQRRNGKRTH